MKRWPGTISCTSGKQASNRSYRDCKSGGSLEASLASRIGVAKVCMRRYYEQKGRILLRRMNWLNVNYFQRAVLDSPTAEVGYKRERCAAHPGSSILTLVTKRLRPPSPPQSFLTSLSPFHEVMRRNDVSPAELLERQPTATERELITKRIARSATQRMRRRPWEISILLWDAMRSEYQRRLGPFQWEGEALLGDDTVVNVSYTVEARSLQEGLPPLHLATIKDFLRFIVASSRRTEKVIFDSMNAFAEWLFAGFLEWRATVSTKGIDVRYSM